MEMTVQKIHEHKVLENGDVELLVAFEDKITVWKKVLDPDISTELDAVKAYLKNRGVSQLGDLNKSNLRVGSTLKIRIKPLCDE